ncbi:MAG: Hsp33 family molecular chaperone HslO, partial [Thermomonas sp.]
MSRFLIEGSGVRGVIVRLTDTWREVRARSTYPHSVAQVLGQTLAASALFTGHAKIAGRLSVQLRGDGALRSVFAECTSAGTLRGLARYDQPLPTPLTPRSFGNDALMAITIENPPRNAGDAGRYQGLVPLDADSLPEAFEHYFNQSEQLPTRIVLATDDATAAGIMLQRLPEASTDEDAEEGWRRASALLDTLDPAELLQLPLQRLLYRLFNQDGVRLLDHRPLQFGCSCSGERVAGMLQGLGSEESLAAADS